MKKRNILMSTISLFLLATTFALAQAPARQPTPNDTLKSPEVLSDGRVAFRIYAPKASEVTVGGDWISQGLGEGGNLTKDDKGVWSITVGPLPADFYSYALTVDVCVRLIQKMRLSNKVRPA